MTNADALRRSLLAVERHSIVRLSPDGRHIAFVRITDAGQELWVRTADGEQKLTAHSGETLGDLRWIADSTTLFYRHAENGRDTWSLTGVRFPDLRTVELPDRSTVTEFWLSGSDPDAILYACRMGESRFADLFQVNLADLGRTAEAVASNPGFHRWLVDGRLRPRGGIKLEAEGSAEIVLGDDLAGARPVLTIDADSLAGFSVQRFSRDGARLFVVTAAGAATRRLIALTTDGTVTTIFEHPDLDLESYPIAGDGVWFNPVSGEPDICTVMDQRLRHHFLSPRLRLTTDRLAADPDQATVIVDRSADDETWLIADVHGDRPLSYHRYYPATGRTDLVIVNRPDLVGQLLPGLEDYCFTASDGRRITGYAMRPLNSRIPLPTIVLVHGGPAGRDIWRFHADAHYFASLGYLSLHVNYRGSRGFGSEFRRAGNGEWGGRMQMDLYEAVEHGVAAGLVDPARVAFFGASYGGYAALLAACTRSDLTRCAIAISPLCDLVALALEPPPYWRPLAASLRKQILERPDGRITQRAVLEQRSPTHVVDASCAPLLIAHGFRDPRIPVDQVDSFVERVTEVGATVRYLRFADEGHQVKSNRNRKALFDEVRAFLEVHIAAGN